MAVAANSRILKGDIDALAALANGKTALGGRPYAFGGSGWRQEFNRLAAAAYAATYGFPGAQTVTNLRPLNRVATTNPLVFPPNPARLFYQDTGRAESILANFYKFPTYSPIINSNFANESSGNSFLFTLTISQPISLGPVDLPNGAAPLEISTSMSAANTYSVSTNWPGNYAFGPSYGMRFLLGAATAGTADNIPAGTYTFSGTSAVPLLSQTGNFTALSYSIASANATPAPGISSAADVLEIVAEDTDPRVFSQGATVFPMLSGWSANRSSSVAGLWLANRPLNWQYRAERGDLMPWNLPPKLWQPLNLYAAAGATIVDSNGNLQSVTATGLNGASPPLWATLAGATTADGAVVWTCGGPAPLQGRLVSCPRHPYARDTVPGVVIPGAVPAAAVNSWIYAVAVNRLRGGGSIPITLGCLRNGSFVSFGTFDTGSGIQSAMWPVFDTAPLLYQADEPVDVQASLINLSDPNPAAGEYFHYAMFADYYNAVENALNLL